MSPQIPPAPMPPDVTPREVLSQLVTVATAFTAAISQAATLGTISADVKAMVVQLTQVEGDVQALKVGQDAVKVDVEGLSTLIRGDDEKPGLAARLKSAEDKIEAMAKATAADSIERSRGRYIVAAATVAAIGSAIAAFMAHHP